MPRVLVVEDDANMRSMLALALSAKGFECRLAQSAGEVLGACLGEPPDLVLLDLQLRDGDGISVCRQLKADPRLRRIPVLLVTGEAGAGQARSEGLAAGAAGYVLKPFSLAELRERIEAALRAAPPA